MEDGGWRMEDGGWRMEDGGWRMEDGRGKGEASVRGGLLGHRIDTSTVGAGGGG